MLALALALRLQALALALKLQALALCLQALLTSLNNNIYSAVIMNEVIVRVHSVHLVNVEQRQVAADPQTKPPDLGCESACRLLSPTTTIARKLILMYRPTEGKRLS